MHIFSDKHGDYEVEKIWKLVRGQEPIRVHMRDLQIDRPMWGDIRPYSIWDMIENPARYLFDYFRAMQASLYYPVIVRDEDYVVVDGLHRIAKLIMLKSTHCWAVFISQKKLLEAQIID